MDKVKQKSQSKARELAIQFLYRCEIEKITDFNEPKFLDFLDQENTQTEIAHIIKGYCQGTLAHLATIDQHISKLSQSWQISRLPMLDRAILRLGMYELLESQTPYKVILNEAIDDNLQLRLFSHGVIRVSVQQVDNMVLTLTKL